MLAPATLLESSLFGVGGGVGEDGGGVGVGVGEDGGVGVGVGEDGGVGVGVGEDGGVGVGVGTISTTSPMSGRTQVPGRMQSGMGAISIGGCGVGAGVAIPQLELQAPGKMQSGMGIVCAGGSGTGGSSALACETVATLTARTAAATRAMKLVALIAFLILFSFRLLPTARFQVYDRRGPEILQPSSTARPARQTSSGRGRPMGGPFPASH